VSRVGIFQENKGQILPTHPQSIIQCQNLQVAHLFLRKSEQICAGSFKEKCRFCVDPFFVEFINWLRFIFLFLSSCRAWPLLEPWICRLGIHGATSGAHEVRR